jgi:hypothetical protein
MAVPGPGRKNKGREDQGPSRQQPQPRQPQQQQPQRPQQTQPPPPPPQQQQQQQQRQNHNNRAGTLCPSSIRSPSTFKLEHKSSWDTVSQLDLLSKYVQAWTQIELGHSVPARFALQVRSSLDTHPAGTLLLPCYRFAIALPFPFYSTAPHRTAPHGTAPHRTAPHGTARHRTAPQQPQQQQQQQQPREGQEKRKGEEKAFGRFSSERKKTKV